MMGFHTWNVCAFLLEDRAESFMHRLNRLVKYNESFTVKINEFNKSFMEPNPVFATKLERDPKFIAAINACQGGKGSKQQKETVRRLQAEHIQKIEFLKEAQHQAHIALQAAKEKYKEENYKPDSDLIELISLLKTNEYNIDFSMEEIEVK